MAFLLGLLLCCAPPGGLQEPPEPPRSAAFPGRASHPLLIRAGTAIRMRYGTAFYTSTLYVDFQALRSKLPKGERPTTATLARALAGGEVPLLFRTQFLQDASGPANLRFIHEALQSRWPKGSFDPMARELDAFNTFFGAPISVGLKDEVGLDGRGGLVLGRGKEREVRIHHPALALAFLRMYFGDRPLDPLFRDSLLLELPAKLQPEGSAP